MLFVDAWPDIAIRHWNWVWELAGWRMAGFGFSVCVHEYLWLKF